MSNDQRIHEIISNVKDLALTLGQTPSKSEVISNGAVKTDHELKKLFGTYSALIQQAGLDPVRKAKKKSPFETSLERHLETYKPRQIALKPSHVFPKYPKIASISDIHWPFENQKVIKAFLDFIEIHQPEWVILNGDAWDMYSMAKFPRSHNQFTPKEEMRMSRERNEQFWLDVKKRCPKAKCYQMLGNHDVRPMKRMMEMFPEGEDWIKRGLAESFTFEGVTTIFDPRQELMIGDIAVFHGYRSKLGEHRDNTMYCCINGHTHRGGTVYRQLRGLVIWELNSGLAGDPEAKGLTYTPQRIIDWTPGFAWVDNYGPRFIHVL